MLLELKNIKKYFAVKKEAFGIGRSVVRAVDDVSLFIQKGENLSLVGESGCGKTTLARIISRLVAPTSGQINFERQNITKLSSKKVKPYRKNIQMVFQDPFNSLDPRFRIRNILLEGFTLDQGKYQSQAEKELRICQLLKAVNLEGDILNRYPHEFSGGERQRIALARALILNPKLVILDEAVSSLDVIIQQQILELLNDIQERFDLTYLFITHNLKVARKISHKIAVMYQGKIVELANTEEIFNNPIHPYTQELLQAAIHYRSIERKEDFFISEDAQFIEEKKGHFVLVN